MYFIFYANNFVENTTLLPVINFELSCNKSYVTIAYFSTGNRYNSVLPYVCAL